MSFDTRVRDLFELTETVIQEVTDDLVIEETGWENDIIRQTVCDSGEAPTVQAEVLRMHGIELPQRLLFTELVSTVVHKQPPKPRGVLTPEAEARIAARTKERQFRMN